MLMPFVLPPMQSIRSLQARGFSLKTLKLAYCMGLTDVALHTLSKRCTKLSTIDLSGCVHFTDDGIKKIASHCRSLQSLGLSRCKRLTDRALCDLADHLWVEELDVSANAKITDEGIDVVAMEVSGSGCNASYDMLLFVLLVSFSS